MNKRFKYILMGAIGCMLIVILLETILITTCSSFGCLGLNLILFLPGALILKAFNMQLTSLNNMIFGGIVYFLIGMTGGNLIYRIKNKK